jgi:hypothetical protein
MEEKIRVYLTTLTVDQLRCVAAAIRKRIRDRDKERKRMTG